MQTKAFLLSRAANRTALLVLVVALIVSCAERHEGEVLSSQSQSASLTTEMISAKQLFRITLELEQEDRIPLGRYHSWLITLHTAQNQPVYPASITVSGGMPSHGHGLPTEPANARHLGKGVYRIDGIKFHMPGEWIVRFNIVTEHLHDYVQATLHIAP